MSVELSPCTAQIGNNNCIQTHMHTHKHTAHIISTNKAAPKSMVPTDQGNNCTYALIKSLPNDSVIKSLARDTV